VEGSGRIRLSLAALIVSIVSLVLAVASITWQAASFHLAGSRVKVTLKKGAAGSGNLVLGHVQVPTESMEDLAAQGIGEPVIAIEARNVGRLGVSVVAWGVVLENGFEFIQSEPVLGNKAMPHRMDAGDLARWSAPLAPVKAAVRVSENEALNVWMYVELGTGRRVTTKERLLISAE